MPTATGHTQAIRASQVIGKGIHVASGEKVGTVVDILLAKANDRIIFAVVSVGGPVTTSENYFPLPWSVLDWRDELGGYSVDRTKDHIVSGQSYSMPELTEDDGKGPHKAACRHYSIIKD